MKPGLFRHEVIESRRQLWLGEIRLARPLSLTLLTTCVVVTALSVAAFLAAGEYTRKARIGGELVPDLGVIRVMPPQSGVVAERRIEEGQAVRAGETLFVLSLEQTTGGGETQAAVQRSLGARKHSLLTSAQQERELFDAKRATVARRIAGMRQELAAIDSQLALQQEQLALGEQALARVKSLRGDNFVSEAQVQAKKEDLLVLRARSKALELSRAVQRREITTLEAEQEELPLRAAARQGEIERDLAQLSQVTAESEAQRRIEVIATSDGVVGAVVAVKGQAVSPATLLATVLPGDGRLRAYLYAPSSAVGFLRPQQEVLLRYQAFPYQKFGHHKGKVLQVSRTPLAPGELGLAQPVGESMYRVTVGLDEQSVSAYGQAQPLVAGMQLEADVLLDRRRLIEWIFEPVLGLSGRV